MKTPHTEYRRALCVWCALVLCAWPLAACAFDLTALAALLAQRKSGQANFTEERTVSGFDSPLMARGTLSFAAPDRFSRETLEPRPESMQVQGNILTLSRSGRTRQLALDTVPELTAMVEALRGTLMGDAATLRKHFHVTVQGSAQQWTLVLRPRDARLAQQVREISMVGQASEPRSVELWLTGGDRSLMLIEPQPRTVTK